MDRPTYWGWCVALFVIYFFFGYLTIGYGQLLDALIVLSVPVYWVIGYQRCQDAGIHGFWAIFTPILIGMIVLGLFPSKEKAL